MNAIMHASHKKMLDQVDGVCWIQYCAIKKFRVPKSFWIHNNATRRGSDPTRV